jgi:hypothetical protein
MRILNSALCLIVLASLLGFGGSAFAATQRECRAACSPYIPELCSGLRPAKAKKCRRIIERACRRLGVLNTCAPPTTTTLPPTTTTTPPASTPSTLPTVATTTTTTSPPSYPTTTTTLLIVPPPTSSCGGQLIVYASDETYLGCITCSTYSSDSISNPYGSYGSPYSFTSVNNQYAPYGSPYSATSACNPYTVSPPSIFDEAGCYYGRLSVNQYVSGSVCGIFGNAALCDNLLALCTN